MQQTPPVDEAPAGLGFVHSGYEVGGTVGLPEFNVVAHAFRMYRKFDGLLCKLVHSAAFPVRSVRILVLSLPNAVKERLFRRIYRSAFIDAPFFVPTSFFRFGHLGQGGGEKFGHSAFLVFPAPYDKILSGTGECHVQQVQVIHPQLQPLVEVILPVNGLRHCGRVVDGYKVYGIVRRFGGGAPTPVGCMFRSPVSESQKGMSTV